MYQRSYSSISSHEHHKRNDRYTLILYNKITSYVIDILTIMTNKLNALPF